MNGPDDYICGKCGSKISKLAKVMHELRCSKTLNPNNNNNQINNIEHDNEMPLIGPSQIGIKLNNDKENNQKEDPLIDEDDISCKECPKCKLSFPEKEIEDHLLCHKLLDDNREAIRNAERIENQRTHHREHQRTQHRENPFERNKQIYEQQLRQQQRYIPQQQIIPQLQQLVFPDLHSIPQLQQLVIPQQPSIPQQPQPINLVSTSTITKTDLNGNIIEESEKRYSDGRKERTTKIYDPLRNNMSTTTTMNSFPNSSVQSNSSHIFTSNIISPNISVPNFQNFSVPNSIPNTNNTFNNMNIPYMRLPNQQPIPNNINYVPPVPRMPMNIRNPGEMNQLLLQMMNQPITNPVPQHLIDQLPQTVVDDASKLAPEKKSCLICLCDFENGDNTIVLPCIHLFHYDCIIEWFRSHNTCPVCKFEIKENNF
jgi:hypothetical protein